MVEIDNNKFRVCCRTCDLWIDITKNDLDIIGCLDDIHSNHEVWIAEPGTEDDFLIRLSDFADDILRERRYKDRQAMSE